MPDWKKNWFVVSKITRIWWILTWALKVLKIFTLIGTFCANCITCDLENYRGVIFHDIEEWYKLWRKTDLQFGKWDEEHDTFSPEHLKVSNLGLWWDRFIQSRKCMSVKLTEELCMMTMKNEAKFEEGLTCHCKIDMHNLTNFVHSKVSKMCALMGSSWVKCIMFELKKYSGVMFHDTEDWCKIWRKTELLFEKWYEEFGKFLPEHLKVSKLGRFIQSRKSTSLTFAE